MKLALPICVIALLTNVSIYSGSQRTQGSTCNGKAVPITLLGAKMSGPRVSFRSGGGFWEPVRLVIREPIQFNLFWKRLHSPDPTHDPVSLPPVPEIDFSREMIVVAAMGQRPSSGYWIIIEGACETDEHLEISVRSINGRRCTALGIFTAPVDVVRIPRTNLPVVFRETEINCDEWFRENLRSAAQQNRCTRAAGACFS
jgi:hypothetical protein